MNAKLTKWEKEILLHRLELVDCLSQCLSAEENDGDGYHPEDIEVACEVQLEKVKAGKLELSETLPDIELACLIDCLEGSTFFSGLDDAVALGEVSVGVKYGQLKAAKTLECKISELAGRDIYVTMH